MTRIQDQKGVPPRGLITVVTILLAATSASLAMAQAAPPSDGPTPPPPTPSGPTANVVGNDAVAESALSGMEETRKVYEQARKLLGGEHVMLTAMAYVSRSCAGGERFFFDDACSVEPATGAVAGIVSVPLWGVGGEHGSDWFPVLHTDEETDAFGKFEARVDDYLNAVRAVTTGSGLPELPSETQQRLYRELLRTVDALTRRADEDDASYFEVARSVRNCVKRLLGKDLTPEEIDAEPPSQSVAEYTWLQRCEKAKADLQQEFPKFDDRLMHAVETVRTYVRFVTAKPALTRHNFLIGPALGFPVTRDPTETLLWGVAAEVGWRDALRLGFGTGFVLAYDAPVAPMSGFYAGIALSGALGDQLVHYLGKAAE
jgi:hypothetical protein